MGGLQQRWQRLPPRDRRMLWVMVVALLVAGLWSLWLEPLLKQRTHWQAELPRLQAQSRALAPLLRARERQQQAQRQHPTLAGLRDAIRTAGLADGLHIEAREGRWHLQAGGARRCAMELAAAAAGRPGHRAAATAMTRTGMRTCRPHGFRDTS